MGRGVLGAGICPPLHDKYTSCLRQRLAAIEGARSLLRLFNEPQGVTEEMRNVANADKQVQLAGWPEYSRLHARHMTMRVME